MYHQAHIQGTGTSREKISAPGRGEFKDNLARRLTEEMMCSQKAVEGEAHSREELEEKERQREGEGGCVH